MNLAYLQHAWPLFLAGAVSLAMAGLGLRRAGAPGARSFVLLMGGLTLWAVPEGLLLLSDSLFWQQTWTKVEYVGIGLVPLFWLTLALEYTGRSHWVTRWKIGPLAVVPFVTIVLAWSFEYHDLIYREYAFIREGGFLHLEREYGRWWWIHAGYSYLLLLWGAGLLLLAAVRTFHLYRSQAIALLLGVSLPVLGNLLYVFRIGSFGDADPTPFLFSLAGIPLAWAVFRLKLFDLVPVAREAVLEGMQDGVLMLDARDRIADLNPAAERALGRSGKKLIGRSVAEALGQDPGEVADGLVDPGFREDVRLPAAEGTRVFEVTGSRVSGRWGEPLGRVLFLRDVTALRAMGERLSSAQEEIRTLGELLPVCAWCHQVRTDEGYWEEMEIYLAKRARTQFTHGICPACRNRLVKQAGSGEESA